MRVVKVVKVICDPDKGCSIHEAVRDSLILALTEDRTVQFFFNETSVVIDPHEVIAEQVRRWSERRPA